MSVAFGKGDRVAFTVRGFDLEGTVVRVRKSDAMVTVNATAVSRMADGTPVLDTREEMWWDVPPSLLTRVEGAGGDRT
jgi:capsule polysaccharide modification protein KpsS